MLLNKRWFLSLFQLILFQKCELSLVEEHLKIIVYISDLKNNFHRVNLEKVYILRTWGQTCLDHHTFRYFIL